MKNIGNSYRRMGNETIKAIATAMASFEEKTKSKLLSGCDFDRTRHYSCIGYQLIGSSVIGFSSGTHFLVANRNYEVYEIPYESNSENFGKGRFLVLFKDVLIGNWLLASLNYTCKTAKEKSGRYLIDTLCEKAIYDLIAESRIRKFGNAVTAECDMTPAELEYAIPKKYIGERFDRLDQRKRAVYEMDPRDFRKKFGVGSL